MARLTTGPADRWRRAAGVLLGLAAALGLAACAGNDGARRPAAQAQPAATAAQPTTPASDGKVRVALLVPLSGPSAAIGTAMLDAAQMALFDVADDRFELMPRDTRATPDGAADAARDAIRDGAKVILGPLFATSAGAVRPIAQAANVNALTFSNDQTVAGGGVYVMGLVPSDQVSRVISYARAQGQARFAVLAPSTAYGDAVVNAAYAAAQANGAQVTRVERYDPAAPDLAPGIKALSDYDQRKAAGQAATSLPFDALMLAEGGDRLRTIAPLLQSNDIDPKRAHLLGTGLWDEPGLGREQPLVGGWYAAPDPGARKDFEARYQALYGQAPPRLATLAYDATALAAVLGRNNPNATFDATSLTNPNGFSGLDGIFRLLPNGLVQRGLAVLEVTPDGARVIDPPPTSFAPPTG